MSNYIKYVGDRIVVDSDLDKPSAIRDGAVLFSTGHEEQELSAYQYLKISGEWVQVKGRVNEDDLEALSGELRADLESTSGDLRSDLESTSGDLRSGLESASGDLRLGLESASGDLRLGLESASGDLRLGLESASGDLRLGLESASGDLRANLESASGILQVHINDLQTLSNPSDGVYGVQGGIAGVSSGDTHEDAFDKVESIFEKLAPPKPSEFEDINFNITQQVFTAFEEGTSVLRDNVINQNTVTAFTDELFYDGEDGTLKAYKNQSLIGEKTLTASEDTGIFSGLLIERDVDYHLGVAGKENFWKGLEVGLEINKTGAERYFEADLCYERGSSTECKTVSGYFGTPVSSSPKSININTWQANSSSKYIDGIPSYVNGSVLISDITAEGLIGSFYRNGVLVSASLQSHGSTNYSRGDINLVNQTNVSNAEPQEGDSLGFSDKSLSINNVNKTNPNLFFRSYDYTGSQISLKQVVTNLYSDSSNQPSARVKSGSGQFPSIFGGTYDNTEELSLNEELQLKQGRVVFPSLNFSNYIPSGPNYSNLQNTSYSNFRWYTINAGQITNKSNVIITINGAQGFSVSSNDILSNFKMYVKINNVTGWIDGNAAFNSGSPSSNGDAALVVGADTSATVRKITFGQTPRSGEIFIRLGINNTSKSFTNLTISFT
jgi:hypothetical protein